MSMMYRMRLEHLISKKLASHKVYRFFFRGVIHFKINIEIADVNINREQEKFLLLVSQRIKSFETIQDMIDSSPTKRCQICLNVTFTETTPFKFRLVYFISK